MLLGRPGTDWGEASHRPLERAMQDLELLDQLLADRLVLIRANGICRADIEFQVLGYMPRGHAWTHGRGTVGTTPALTPHVRPLQLLRSLDYSIQI